MKSLTCFSSRSRGTCCAVILERLAEICRGRTTAIICTRTNAPKYILESHRLHFGSICDQNGRNFEPCVGLVTRGCGFESQLRQELSTTEVRPLSMVLSSRLLPGRRWVGCLLQVCVHLDGLNAENTFHCWL